MSELHCCLRKGVPFEDPVLGHLASPTGNRILTFRSNIVSSFGRVRTFGPLNLLPRNAEILYYVAPYHKTSDSPITQLRKPQTSQMPLQPQNLEIQLALYVYVYVITCGGVAGGFNSNSVTMLMTKRPGMTSALLIMNCLQLHVIVTEYWSLEAWLTYLQANSLFQLEVVTFKLKQR